MAVTQPPIREPQGVDPQWQEKTARAKQARVLFKQIRTSKPTSFRRAIGRTTLIRPAIARAPHILYPRAA